MALHTLAHSHLTEHVLAGRQEGRQLMVLREPGQGRHTGKKDEEVKDV